jgi:hypothetical protein
MTSETFLKVRRYHSDADCYVIIRKLLEYILNVNEPIQNKMLRCSCACVGADNMAVIK